MRALASFQDLYVGKIKVQTSLLFLFRTVSNLSINILVGLEPYRNSGEVAGGVIKKTAPAVFGLLAALELHPSNKLAGGMTWWFSIFLLPVFINF